MESSKLNNFGEELLRFHAWQTIREAVRGSSIDYTTAPIGRAIVMLAIPMVMEMAMESIFAVADVFWVAHLGADAVAYSTLAVVSAIFFKRGRWRTMKV